MSDIEPVHRIAYEHGADPVEWAVKLISFDLDARALVAAGQIKHGHAITLMDQSDEAYARRIIAKLLDAGWTPPAKRTGESS